MDTINSYIAPSPDLSSLLVHCRGRGVQERSVANTADDTLFF